MVTKEYLDAISEKGKLVTVISTEHSLEYLHTTVSKLAREAVLRDTSVIDEQTLGQ